MGAYVFVWASEIGPEVRRFKTANELLAYLSGWCHAGSCVLAVSMKEFRG